jgi:hypothetical protein
MWISSIKSKVSFVHHIHEINFKNVEFCFNFVQIYLKQVLESLGIFLEFLPVGLAWYKNFILLKEIPFNINAEL